MSNYRPITDTWILAREKLKGGQKFYGSYLGGFPERARVLLGVTIDDPVLHVCGGMARAYPYKGGFGPNDKTMDLDPRTEPNLLHDAREPWMYRGKDDPDYKDGYSVCVGWRGFLKGRIDKSCEGIFEDYKFKAYLIDPPYSETDAEHYIGGTGASVYPSPSLLLKRAFEVMEVGQRVGIIHYMLPKPPPNARFVACVQVICGFNNRARCYSVFEKLA